MSAHYRFGPFELDPAEVSLSALAASERRPVALTRRSFDTLLYLVEHPGRLVSREELIGAVWGETIVEERNLHWTISAVRRALAQESPEAFIETVRGRGYRFVAPVEALVLPEPGRPVPAVPVTPAPPPEPSEAPPVADSGPVDQATPENGALRRWQLLAVGSFEISGFAVAGFRNLSPGGSEGWIGTALAEMLAADLARHGPRLVASDDVASLRRDLGLEPGAPLGPRELALLRQRLAAEWVVTGSYLVLGGTELRVDAQLRDTATGEVLARASGRGRTGDLFVVTDALSRDLGATLSSRGGGETVQSGAGAAAAVPAEPRAQRFYAEGLAHLQRMDAQAAAERLEKAVAADPAFPGAWLALARASELLGSSRRAEEAALAAVERSAGRPEAERLAAEAMHLRLTQRRPEAVERLQRLYDGSHHRFEDGLALAETQLQAGQAQEALATVEQLRGEHRAATGDARLSMLEMEAANLMEDFPRLLAAAGRTLAAARRQGMVQVEIRALRRQAFARTRTGTAADCRTAVRDLTTARRRAEELGDRLLLGAVLHDRATALSHCGEPAGAEEAYREALDVYRALGAWGRMPNVLYNLGNIRLEEGDLLATDRLMREALELCQAHATLCRERFAHPLGVNRLHRGELGKARRLIEEGIDRNRRLGNRSRVAEASGFLPDLAAWSGDLEQALEAARRTLVLRRDLGTPADIAWAHSDLGYWLAEAGHGAEAVAQARQAVELAASQDDQSLTACSHASLAFGHLAAGDLPAADRESARALGELRPPRSPFCSFQVWRVRAEVLLAAASSTPPDP